MQKRLLFFACLLLAICNKMAAADQIVVSDFSIYSGNKQDVDVVLTNTDSSVGFQFDLYLPEGIVLDGYIGSNRLPEGTSLQMRQQDDGGYRFVAASMERNTIIGNDGAVITLILQATANAVPGSYTGYLRAAKVSKADGTGSTINEMPFTVTVEANTAEPYAVLSEDSLTVTFYYDDQKASRGGMEINSRYINTYNGEKNPYGTAVTAIIDDSFANYTTLRSTSCWFMECNNLTEIRGIANLKTANVTDMSLMFYGCSGLTSLDVSGFNTANVTSMSLMFDGCSGLTSLDVSGFNTANVTDMHYMFSGCSGLTSLDVSGFNTANVTNMYSMFSYCSGLTSLDVSGFNTANVTNMVSMFSGCSGLTSLDVSGFNTANVMYMHQMFELCSGLTSLDLRGFNTGNVTDMGSMFELCSGLTSLDVSGFNTANVTYMSKMFENCSSLRTIYVSDSWNTSAVTIGGNMFVDCISLVGGAGTTYDANHIDYTYAHIDGGVDNPGYFTDINAPAWVEKPSAPEFAFEGDNLTMTTQTEGASIFYAMADLPSTDDEAVVDSVTNSFTVKVGVDDGNYYYEQPFELKKSVVVKAIAVGNGTNGQEAVSDTTVLVYDYEAWVNLLQAVVYGSDVLDRSQGNSKVDQNLVEELKWMLDECSMIYSHRATMPYFEAKHFTNQILALCEQIESQLSQGGTPEPYAVLSDSNTVLTFYYDDQKATRNGMSVGPFDGNPDYQAWYDQRESITSVVFDASFANCTTITSTAYWFYGCEKLTTITGISNLKTGNVTDMGCMFYGCANLASLDVSHFDTSLVEGMYFMFANCSKLTNLDLSNFNTSNVKKMHFMFRDCSALQSIALSNFNTSNVIWMHLMFDGCSNLTSLDVSNFDTSNVTEIEAMFRGCSNLTSLDVSHFNTSKAKYMGAMFNDCRKLKSIDVSHFDTSNAESMLQMFAGCYSLTSLDVSNFNTAKVTNMKNMFSGCSNLVDINMSNFNTDNVTDMSGMFSGCSGLTSLDVSGFKTDNVTDMGDMFAGCSGLMSLDVSSFNTANVTTMGDMFAGCSGLTSLDLSSFNTSNVRYDGYPNFGIRSMFSGCSSLTTIFAGDGWSTDQLTEGSGVFKDCINLVGGAGTAYDAKHTDYTYAHIDGGIDNPGYFTDKNAPAPEEKPSAPEFAFEGDNLTMTTQTEGASIFYAMADLPSTDDEAIVDSVTNSFTVKVGVDDDNFYYEQPFELRKSVVLKAIAVGNGTGGQEAVSDTTVLVYDYEAWVNLLQAVVYGSDVLDRSQGNSKVDQNLVEELKWMLDECSMIYSHRATMPYFEAKHFTNQILALCEQIESQLSQGGTPEPYAVLSDSNTVLTFYYDDQKASRNGMGVGPFELVYVDGQPTANSDWFSKRANITEVVFDESFANATTLTSTALWFYKCEKLTKVSGLHYLYTANVTDMNHMFGGCRLLTDLDLSNFNTANVKNMNGMFSEAGFTNLDLSSFDTSNVTDMYGLFWGTTGLKNVDLSSFNTSSVTTMRGMFNYCWNLSNIDLSNFDTSSATDIAVMFNECSGLTSLDLSNFKTDNVEEMTYMFRGCSHLTNVDLSSFNTGNVTYMINMFEGCTSLTTLDLSSFNTAKLKYVSQMFKGCSALNTIYVGSEWTTNNIETSNEMFSGCTNLIGGKGTHYNANHTDYTYAHIDGGPSNPGYFTAKDAPVIDATFDSNGVLTIGSGTTMTDALESVGGRAEVAKTITAIVWNNETELTDADLQGLDNPNMLIYVNNESLAPQNRNNIITYDFAKNIVLTDVTEGNGNFYCPQEFKAEKITYSHDYGQTTEIDVARGWESIALPFTVQTITHETKGQIAPFGSTASGKHFWLRQLTENGLARATEIEPNTAYLISMPNNDAYYADFNLNGLVTFSSVDVWVPKTQIHAVDYHTEKGMVVLLPNFQRRASDYTTYALNVGEQRGDYPEGSVFEREYRDIRPFEAYTFHQGGSAPRFLPISDLNGDDATGIEEVRSLRTEGRGDVWYDMSGRRLQQKPAGKGVYILNGRKVVIK